MIGSSSGFQGAKWTELPSITGYFVSTMIGSSSSFQRTKWTEPPKKVGHESRGREGIINKEERGDGGGQKEIHWVVLKFRYSKTREHSPRVFLIIWSPLRLIHSSDQAIKLNLPNSFSFLNMSFIYFHAIPYYHINSHWLNRRSLFGWYHSGVLMDSYDSSFDFTGC